MTLIQHLDSEITIYSAKLASLAETPKTQHMSTSENKEEDAAPLLLLRESLGPSTTPLKAAKDLEEQEQLVVTVRAQYQARWGRVGGNIQSAQDEGCPGQGQSPV